MLWALFVCFFKYGIGIVELSILKMVRNILGWAPTAQSKKGLSVILKTPGRVFPGQRSRKV